MVREADRIRWGFSHLRESELSTGVFCEVFFHDKKQNGWEQTQSKCTARTSKGHGALWGAQMKGGCGKSFSDLSSRREMLSTGRPQWLQSGCCCGCCRWYL